MLPRSVAPSREREASMAAGTSIENGEGGEREESKEPTSHPIRFLRNASIREYLDGFPHDQWAEVLEVRKVYMHLEEMDHHLINSIDISASSFLPTTATLTHRPSSSFSSTSISHTKQQTVMYGIRALFSAYPRGTIFSLSDLENIVEDARRDLASLSPLRRPRPPREVGRWIFAHQKQLWRGKQP